MRPTCTSTSLDPDYADAHNNLGSVYFRTGRRDLAEREYRTALRLAPGSEAIRRNLVTAVGADAVADGAVPSAR